MRKETSVWQESVQREEPSAPALPGRKLWGFRPPLICHEEAGRAELARTLANEFTAHSEEHAHLL